MSSAIFHTHLKVMGMAKTASNEGLVFWQNRPCKGGRILPMKKKFSVERVVSVLKQAEIRVPVAELIRKVGIALKRALAQTKTDRELAL
jgi:hypothetical protein